MNATSDFWSRVDQSGGPEACWPWTGTTNRQGYGRLWWEGRDEKAHRVALRLSGQPVPGGALVCHGCDNPPCCNPAHLRIGTVADNAADMVARGRQPIHMRARVSCRRGHALTGDNVRVDGRGGRHCRACSRDTQRAFRATPEYRRRDAEQHRLYRTSRSDRPDLARADGLGASGAARRDTVGQSAAPDRGPRSGPSTA